MLMLGQTLQINFHFASSGVTPFVRGLKIGSILTVRASLSLVGEATLGQDAEYWRVSGLSQGTSALAADWSGKALSCL